MQEYVGIGFEKSVQKSQAAYNTFQYLELGHTWGELSSWKGTKHMGVWFT